MNLENQFNNSRSSKRKKSQLQQLIDRSTVRVAIVDDNAYWVNNNSIYKANIDEFGRIDLENAIVVDAFSLSEKETQKLLEIIDSIQD